MKKKLLLILGALIFMTAGVWVYSRLTDDERPDSNGSSQAQIDQMNAGDSTTDSEKDSEGQQASSQNQASSKPSTDKQLATVSISEAGPDGDLVVVRAFANILEDGSCKAIFTKGTITKSYTENTEQQAQYTQCNPFQIPKDEFSTGTWKVAVTFESSHYKGSAEREFSL